MKKLLAVIIAIGLLLSSSGCQNTKEVNTEVQAPERNISQEHMWDLTHIFEDVQAFETALKEFEDELVPGLAAYAGTLNKSDVIYSFLSEFDHADRVIDRLYGYAQLQCEQNQLDNQATAMLHRVVKAKNNFTDAMAFSAPELLLLPDGFWDEILREERMQPYAYEINLMRRNSAHILPENEAVFLTPLTNAADNAYILFSKLTDADMEFPAVKDPQGNMVTADETVRLSVLTGHPNREFRKNIAEANFSAYGRFRNTLAQNLDTFVRLKVSLARFKHYSNGKEAALKTNAIIPEVYDNIIAAANNNLDAAHRNVALRKKILGTDKIYSSDMLYPLTEEISASFTYEDGKNIIIEALAPLGSEYQSILKKSFAENWIDVYPAEGKNSGAFSAGINNVHPYILMNYTDDFYSVSTLAHELGHAVHQYLSEQSNKSFFTGSVTIFSTEVASTVSELLLSDYMIQNASTKNEKLYYLFSELDTLYGTFFRQVMYAEFEDSIYKTVEDGGSLTADTLEELWTDVLVKYHGSDYEVTNNAKFGGSRIPHFYANYYVYQYATSIAAACVISQRITNGESGAVEDYLTFLKAGNSNGGVELLKALGVDMTKTDYTNALISRYNSIIDQIEELLGK